MSDPLMTRHYCCRRSQHAHLQAGCLDGASLNSDFCGILLRSNLWRTSCRPVFNLGSLPHLPLAWGRTFIVTCHRLSGRAFSLFGTNPVWAIEGPCRATR